MEIAKPAECAAPLHCCITFMKYGTRLARRRTAVGIILWQRNLLAGRVAVPEIAASRRDRAIDCSRSISAKSQASNSPRTVARSFCRVNGFPINVTPSSGTVVQVPDISSVAVEGDRVLIERTS